MIRSNNHLNDNSVNKFMFVVVVAFNFLFPTFNSILGGDDGGGKIGAIFINAGLFLLLLSFLVNIKRINRTETIVISFGITWFILICVSMLISPGKIITSDIFELHRPLLYSITVLFGMRLYENGISIQNVERCLIIVGSIVIIFACIQNLDLFKPLKAMYTKTHNVHTGRATGTFVNPYDFSVFAILMLGFYVVSTLDKVFSIKNIKSMFLIGCVFISLVLSQSRTGFILIFVYFFVLFFLLGSDMIKSKFKRVKKSALILILFFVFVVVLFFSFDYLEVNYPYLIHGVQAFIEGNNTSFNARDVQLKEVIQLTSKNVVTILFGNGPSKATMSILEMQYILYGFRYGLVGLILLVTTMIIFSYSSVVSFLNAKTRTEKNFFLVISSWLISMFIASFTNAYIDIIRLQFLYFSLGGISIFFAFVMRYKRYESVL
ncbi:O-antigen ligase family protein [Vibrio sp. PID23_8]|uniref:O-antigen ligase family protein n=1 Tax=Vibrio sp. PID23_8 TaxID=1583767 RepID=UPI000E69DC20|nr:O-antigen ligase family protein [Vibrio sp. PID23_8]RIZ54461.1 hypothetical protein AK966_08520 [Vibrio sp. PID23_8]